MTDILRQGAGAVLHFLSISTMALETSEVQQLHSAFQVTGLQEMHTEKKVCEWKQYHINKNHKKPSSLMGKEIVKQEGN